MPTQKDTPITTIYKTTNYDKFALAPYSRPIINSRVKKLMFVYEKETYIAPIEVYKQGRKLIIINGQHRFLALKKLNKPVVYYVTYDQADNFQKTHTLVTRNAETHWSTIEQVESLAKNPHNFKTPAQAKAGMKEYRTLFDLITYTYQTIGQSSNTTIIKLAQGFDSALHQPKTGHHAPGWKTGEFVAINPNGYKHVIDRIHTLQSQVAYFKLTSTLFRAIYALLADSQVDIRYFAWTINRHEDEFKTILQQRDATQMLRQLISFYNVNRRYYTHKNKPLPISSARGKHGVIMTGKRFRHDLFLD